MSASRSQSEFFFESNTNSNSSTDGLNIWRKQREDDLAVLAQRAGLPIGHETEVWLKGGVRLRGILRLQEEKLLIAGEEINQLKLTVEGVPFTRDDLESCIRLD